MVRSTALRESCHDDISKVRDFLLLYDYDWQILAIQARACHEEEKGNCPEELPLEKDIKLFKEFMIQKIIGLTAEIKSKRTTVAVRKLAKFTLARLLTFNARQGSEVGKLKLKHWKGVLDGRWKRRTDLESLDDPIEKLLAERMQLCFVEGKKKRAGAKKNNLVSILFTEECIEAIMLIVSDLEDDDSYIFSTGQTNLSGWDTLQNICKIINGLEKAHLITPTRTRKFMSTILQLMNMTDAELGWVTNHFGKTKNVHFSWYRREDATIELTKIAKVLLAVDTGEVLKNKKIDEVNTGAVLPNVTAVEQNESKREAETQEDIEEDISQNNRKRKHANTDTDVDNVYKKLSKSSDSEQQLENEDGTEKKDKRWNPWSDEEIKVLKKAFRCNFMQRVVPSRMDVRSQMRHFAVLRLREVDSVRNKIRNELKKGGFVK